MRLAWVSADTLHLGFSDFCFDNFEPATTEPLMGGSSGTILPAASRPFMNVARFTEWTSMANCSRH
jgi:hypothetical protein